MSFQDELQYELENEYKDLQPAVLGILKKGMKEGEKRSEKGKGIDKIQLDSAKAASYVAQYYIEQLIGKPLSRAEISGKNGSPLNVKLNFVLSEEPNIGGIPAESIDTIPVVPVDSDLNPDNSNGELREDSPNP